MLRRKAAPSRCSVPQIPEDKALSYDPVFHGVSGRGRVPSEPQSHLWKEWPTTSRAGRGLAGAHTRAKPLQPEPPGA